MKLVEINWQPTDKQLQQFGVVALFALPILGWWWSGGNSNVIGVLAALGVTVSITGHYRPQWLKPLFVGLTLLFLPIGLVVSEVVLLLIYSLVFVPIGLVFRLMRRDKLERKLDRAVESYWQAKRQPSGPASYYRQF